MTFSLNVRSNLHFWNHYPCCILA